MATTEKGRSKQEIGEASLARLRTWLDAAPVIPERGGKANISAIGTASKVDRQVLYRKKAKAMIADAVARVGLGMPNLERGPGDAALASASRRIKQLEEQLAVVTTEVQELRRRLRHFERLEAHVTATGLLPR